MNIKEMIRQSIRDSLQWQLSFDERKRIKGAGVSPERERSDRSVVQVPFAVGKTDQPVTEERARVIGYIPHLLGDAVSPFPLGKDEHVNSTTGVLQEFGKSGRQEKGKAGNAHNVPGPIAMVYPAKDRSHLCMK